MEDKKLQKEIIEYEEEIIKAETEHIQEETKILKFMLQSKAEEDEKLYAAVSKRVGKPVDKDNISTVSLPNAVWGEIYDEVSSKQNCLIRPSHLLLPFSLIRKSPELQKHVPEQEIEPGGLGVLKLLGERSTSRAMEIIKEYSSENTRIAHQGDLVYWQAFLSAIGFTFEDPIGEKEVITYIIQHVEGFEDADMDKKLVEQGFKGKLGPHKLATVKRRIASLSVFCDLAGWPNPTHSKEITQLLQKLTKKYGSSKPAGKAITKNILDDILYECEGNNPIDIRDKAMFLFAWGSGGRRRSEVTTANMKDLVKTPENEFVYTIPQSKTDQEGKGHPVPVNGRAARALIEWLTVSGITEGPIFRSITRGGRIKGELLPKDIYRIIKRRLKKAGYDESQFGAHSLRSGFVTTCGRMNKPLGDVMQMTTHRNVGTVMRYYQAGSVSNNSAANLAD